MALVSVIIPVYNEEESVGEMVQRLNQVAVSVTRHEMEFIFVDDGSTDGTLPRLRQLVEEDPRVRVISFSRNFGSHAALRAGFSMASGAAAINLSGDMQDPPEIIQAMTQKWDEGAEIVWGVRAGRDDAAGYVGFARLYYWLVRRFALPQMPEGGVDLVLMDRKVLDAVLGSSEKNTSIFGLIMWMGFKQVFVPYHRQARKFGRSKWSFGRKVKLIIDSLTSFSITPIRIWSYFGSVVALFGIVLLAASLASLAAQASWAWFGIAFAVLATLVGLNLLAIGVIGEYVWRAFDEVRHRPAFVVRETFGFEQAEMGRVAEQFETRIGS